MTWSGRVGSASMDWRRKLRFRRRIWPSSVLTLKERGASCFSTTMAGYHVRPCWTVTGTPVWSAGRALVPRSWYLFCLCCLASKDLCKSSATFGDRRIVAVDSLSFNTRHTVLESTQGLILVYFCMLRGPIAYLVLLLMLSRKLSYCSNWSLTFPIGWGLVRTRCLNFEAPLFGKLSKLIAPKWQVVCNGCVWFAKCFKAGFQVWDHAACSLCG